MGTDSNGLDGEIQSIGDLLTQRQRKRFKAGDTLLGRYRILGELGQGGMGLVFRCMDEIGGIEVAVKMLPPEVSHDSGEMEDVRENFRLVSSLVHQNICAVRTLDKDPSTGEYFLVMELAQGMNLRAWRKAKAVGQQGVALPDTLPIIRQIAAALDHAHEHKVVHRDVKPSNVMVDAQGRVKVLDFGLAAQIHTSFSRISHVRYGTSGTGPYMAPEQWRGEYQDGATDQYALAVLAYELLRGHCPFEGHDTVILREVVLSADARPIEGMPEYAMEALTRALAKERTSRHASCGVFVERLAGETFASSRSLGAEVVEEPAKKTITVEQWSSDYDQALLASQMDQRTAIQLLDAWTTRKKYYLWPISEHAVLVGFNSQPVFRVGMSVFIETRQCKHKLVPCSRSARVKIKPFPKGDEWRVHIAPPPSYDEKTSVWSGDTPFALIDCPECEASGYIRCPECDGIGRTQEKCSKCNGSGEVSDGIFDDKIRQCHACGGGGTVTNPCPKCKEKGKIICPVCEGKNGVLLFPEVVAEFKTRSHISNVVPEQCKLIYSRGKCRGIPVWEGTAEGPELVTLPSNVLPQASTEANMTMLSLAKEENATRNQIHRSKMALSLVPCTTCMFRRNHREFGFAVVGLEQAIKRIGRVPLNLRWVLGSLLSCLLAIGILTACIVLVAAIIDEDKYRGPFILLLTLSLLPLYGSIRMIRYYLRYRPVSSHPETPNEKGKGDAHHDTSSK